MTTLAELDSDLTVILETWLPSVMDQDIMKMLNQSYLDRMKFANKEMVNNILQMQPVQGGGCPLVRHQRRLQFIKRVLGVLLLVLPQSFHQLIDAISDEELQNNFFRQDTEKNILDVTGCRECYTRDAKGVCRELFFCKRGEDVSSRASLLELLNG
nr:uncharacterized protein LOC128688350 [Cherax quadricarinatus]